MPDVEVAAPPVAAPAPSSMGGLIDRLFHLRERKRLLQEEIKVIDSESALHEATLMARMDDEQTRRSEGKFATVTISESVVGRVSDWDKFFAFVGRKKLWHLLQRRTSDPAVREMFQMKGDDAVPGVEPFTKRTLNLRRI